MTNRENFVNIGKRKGIVKAPILYNMCPEIQRKFNEYCKETGFTFDKSDLGFVDDLSFTAKPPEYFKNNYYTQSQFKKDPYIDQWGIAHESGSEAAFHMTYMHHPMDKFDSVEQIESYPFPIFNNDLEKQTKQVENFHKNGNAAMGNMQMTIWEQAWYLRGMENLMCDMMTGDDMATILLDKVTNLSIQRAQSFAKAGVDCIFFGDDIGMQQTIMMSENLYQEWLQPRLKKIIKEVKSINPDILVFYHSCGYVKELIPYLIQAGIDVLDPVQPECMDFKEIHDMFGDKLSFHGTIGTQSTMPHGTPDDVRKKVFENLDIASKKGGLYVCPTHILEPEVPIENIVSYIKACEEYFK